VARGVNYIAIKSSTALDGRTVVVLLYIHPDNEEVNITTKETVCRTIENYMNDSLVIIGGDLNATLE
jgi:hypothetical protein